MNAKTERIHLNVTEEEKEIIDQKAQDCGMNRSEYLRHVAMECVSEYEDRERLHADFLLLCERVHKLTERPFADTFIDDGFEIIEDFLDLVYRYRRSVEIEDD